MAALRSMLCAAQRARALWLAASLGSMVATGSPRQPTQVILDAFVSTRKQLRLMLVVVGSSSRLNPRLNALAAVGSVSVDTASTDGGSTALILGAVG
eukprot:CAMPEP_0118819514 /NCGR_PEP_ID=MMETSP1162-20130426/7016_1 /TAXON_ID=33656 /ORGANISM="Phaeocystis Sp, Strain CCMP2710" /LENGTH=96 /DNA_ID=CAMNT_0006749809 /DNA_START=209 /DNA_END=496 /DNA_ORIENTATION=+